MSLYCIVAAPRIFLQRKRPGGRRDRLCAQLPPLTSRWRLSDGYRNPSSCPHCGGENGFHTKEVVISSSLAHGMVHSLRGSTPSAFESILLLRLRSEYYIADHKQEPLTIPNDTFYVLSLEIFLKGRYTGGIVDVGVK